MAFELPPPPLYAKTDHPAWLDWFMRVAKTANATVDYANGFANEIFGDATAGYMLTGGGVIWQWGRNTVVTTLVVTLPTAFKQTPLFVIGSNAGSSPGNNVVAAYDVSLTQVALSGSSGGGLCAWLALGI